MSTSTPKSPSSTSFALLINRNFALLWIGQTISVIGDLFFSTTLILWVTEELAKGQPWLALAVSALAIATALPSLVVGPLAGVFVDRWDKRRTMLWMDTLRSGLVGVLLILIVLLPAFLAKLDVHLWLLGSLYALNVLMSCCAQFFGPARLVLIGDIVPEEQRPHAISLISLGFNMGAGSPSPF